MHQNKNDKNPITTVIPTATDLETPVVIKKNQVVSYLMNTTNNGRDCEVINDYIVDGIRADIIAHVNGLLEKIYDVLGTKQTDYRFTFIAGRYFEHHLAIITQMHMI